MSVCKPMDDLLASLRACAEPTRLRLLALAARGAFCVVELTEILGQSQPRLSRHLRLLCEAGLLERQREGANVWFTLAPGTVAGALLARLPEDDAVLTADRRHAARVQAERARIASEDFRRQGADWDEMGALTLPAEAVVQALVALLPDDPGRLLDIGTGTGALLEQVAPRVRTAIGIDASRSMLALARTRLARGGLGHCSVRLGDMYRLPFADGAFDVAVVQMVLHYAEDPAGAIAEAARVLRPGGHLIVVDLALHAEAALVTRRAHRWPGFSDAGIDEMFTAAGLRAAAPHPVAGPLVVKLWPATREAAVVVARDAVAHDGVASLVA